MIDLGVLALKSVVVAGAALLWLYFSRNKSAADRSWIAHLGLFALLLIPLGGVALPPLKIHTSGLVPNVHRPIGLGGVQPSAPSASPQRGAARSSRYLDVELSPEQLAYLAYGIPAVALLILTLLSIAKLAALRARATVLVEPHWATALARAQSRMGFKHGTALLISPELPSPVSWGVVRPVILLNAEAADAHHQAEAILAHELTHVARLDWAKLLLAQLVTALLWFNPLVWLLAREAHQLREEAADDAVLASDIEETAYARLLIQVARHETRGFLGGAHGVAIGPYSLTRRINRVLDKTSRRAPSGWPWSLSAALLTAAVAFPLSAMSVAPAPQPQRSRESPIMAAEGLTSAPRLIRTFDKAYDAFNIKKGGQVIVRYGEVPQVRLLRGDMSDLSVSPDDGELSIRCLSHCSNLLVEITTSRLRALATVDGGEIQVASGFPSLDRVAIATVNAGLIDTRLLHSRAVAAATISGGTILTFASERLAASTNNGGVIEYWGTKNVAPVIAGSGAVRPGPR